MTGTWGVQVVSRISGRRNFDSRTEALTDLDVSDTGAVWQFAFDVTTRNDYRGMAQLLERCPSSRYTCRPRTGATLLHVAANVDAVDCMLLLLRNDASDIDQADSTGATALMVAARNGFIRSLRCLVRLFSAEVNKSDRGPIFRRHPTMPKNATLFRPSMAAP